MTGKTNIRQLSGLQFAAFLKTEMAHRNAGLGRLTYEKLGRACGVSGKRLRQLADEKNAGNPSALTIRLVLFTLGYEVDSPEHDVVPHLQDKGAYSEGIHGKTRQRSGASNAPPTQRVS
ncbi:hypothetical protein EBB79_13220 [Parasedimentitalea marina]|uniref:XRE family transcriptional regulator n=1 Tax=Parasedimentitalea marina TaxID=2483033 RepID=A0A3T0N411_9RHOB|nr:hypothetical protein EBB79_13220 [Parasedimentitalea marina]